MQCLGSGSRFRQILKRIQIQVPSNPETDPDPGHEHFCKVCQFLDLEILLCFFFSIILISLHLQLMLDLEILLCFLIILISLQLMLDF